MVSLPNNPEEEDFKWDKQTFLEWLFFKIIDIFFIVIDKLRKIPHVTRSCDQESFFDRAVNMFIVFFILIVFFSIILGAPLIIAPADPTKLIFIYQIILTLLLSSIAWSCYVYLVWDFKELVRTKIPPEDLKNKYPLLKPFFLQIFNGFGGRPSGSNLRLYIRDFFGFIWALSAIWIAVSPTFFNSWQLFLSNINFINTISLFVNLLSIFLLSIPVFIVISTLLTVFLMLGFLLIGVLIFSLEINPYFEMGDTQKYGNLLIKTLYKSAFAIGIFPLLSLMNQIDFNKILSLQTLVPISENQTIQSITNVTKDVFNNSIYNVPISYILKYSFWIFSFLIIVVFCFIIIEIIHYRIQIRKIEEQKRLEGMLSYSKLVEPENTINRDRDQHQLVLYHQLSNLYEWPVKRIFLVDLFISILLLFISHLFS